MNLTQPPTPLNHEAVLPTPEEFAIALDLPEGREASPAQAGQSSSSIAVALALLIYLLADLVLLLTPWAYGQLGLVVALGLISSQVSLVVFWVCSRKMPAYARFVIVLFSTGWAWYITISVSPGLVVGSAESAVWAMGLGAQAVAVLAVVALRSVLLQIRDSWRRDPKDEDARHWCQYGIGSLMGWTAVTALLLGFGQTAAKVFDWNVEVAGWGASRVVLVLCLFNATYALLVMLSLLRRRWLAVRVVVALLLIAALAAAQPSVLRMFFGSEHGLDMQLSLVFAAPQAVLLYAASMPILLLKTSPGAD